MSMVGEVRRIGGRLRVSSHTRRVLGADREAVDFTDRLEVLYLSIT